MTFRDGSDAAEPTTSPAGVALPAAPARHATGRPVTHDPPLATLSPCNQRADVRPGSSLIRVASARATLAPANGSGAGVTSARRAPVTGDSARARSPRLERVRNWRVCVHTRRVRPGGFSRRLRRSGLADPSVRRPRGREAGSRRFPSDEGLSPSSPGWRRPSYLAWPRGSAARTRWLVRPRARVRRPQAEQLHEAARRPGRRDRWLGLPWAQLLLPLAAGSRGQGEGPAAGGWGECLGLKGKKRAWVDLHLWDGRPVSGRGCSPGKVWDPFSRWGGQQALLTAM